MKKYLIVCLLLGLISWACSSESDLPRCKVPRIKVSPVIDGKIDDAVWKQAAVIDRFMHLQTATPVKIGMEVRIAYDDDTLYLGYRCPEEMIDQLLNSPAVTQRDGRVWDNDCIEFFYAENITNGRNFQFITNWKKGLYDSSWYMGGGGKVKSNAWNGIWHCETSGSRQGKYWCAEMAIPFDTLEIPPEKCELRVNFTREKYTQPSEFSAWSSPLRTTFNVPERYGFLSGIQRRPYEVKLTEIKIPKAVYGKNVLTCRAVNTTDRPWKGKIIIECYSPTGKMEKRVLQNCNLEAKQSREMKLEYQLTNAAGNIIRIGTSDAEGRVRFQKQKQLQPPEMFRLGNVPRVVYRNEKAAALADCGVWPGEKKITVRLLKNRKVVAVNSVKGEKRMMPLMLPIKVDPGIYEMNFELMIGKEKKGECSMEVEVIPGIVD